MKKVLQVLSIFNLAIRYSFSFCWRNAKWLTIGRLVTVLFDAVKAYAIIWIVGRIINIAGEMPKGMSPSDFVVSDVGKLLGALLGLFALGVVNSRFKWCFRQEWNETLSFANKRELQKHRISLDVARFMSKEFDNLTKQIEDIPGSWGVRMTFAEEMLNLFSVTVTLITFGVSLFVYSPVYFFVILLACIPIIIGDFKIINLWWTLYTRMVPHKKKKQVQERAYYNTQTFVQAQMFGQADMLEKSINRNNAMTRKMYSVLRGASVRSEFLTHSIATLGFAVVISHVIWKTTQGSIGVGSLAVIFASAQQFLGSIEGVVNTLSDQWNSARGIILIEKDFFGLKSMLLTKDPVSNHHFHGNSGPKEIQVKNICFSYPSTEALALKNVSFSIKRGEKIAVVGKSGSGKSSLFNVLARHYDPNSGEILIDGVPLSRIPPEIWIKHVSGLTQKYSIVPRTIEKEISSSMPGLPISRSRLQDAIEWSAFDEVARSKPHALAEQIGTEFGGCEFSGGEEQRLALARVLYRGTPILMLDEPDGKLDPETAEVVMDSIYALKNVTVILITHHVSRAARCDRIILLDKGEIAETGQHLELMARNGKYASMFNKDKERLSA